MQRKIAIIGGAPALMLTQKGLGDITLIDLPHKEKAVKGKTLDIMAARPHHGQDTALSGSGDLAALAGAEVVAITAGVPRKPGMSRDDLLAINLGIIRNLAEAVKDHAPEALAILTTNPSTPWSTPFTSSPACPNSGWRAWPGPWTRPAFAPSSAWRPATRCKTSAAW